MEDAMDRFVACRNIQHFRHILETTSDPEQRRAISALLQSEIEKFAPEERNAFQVSHLAADRGADV